MKRILCVTAPIAACLAVTSHFGFAQGRIETLVGRDWVFPISVGAALNAPIGRIEQIATDKSGNLYIADGDNDRVFRISSSGTLLVVAGNGIRGFSGDNGPATSASLNVPSGVAVDDAGAVYIADSRNHRVRKVGIDGIIKTLAGTGAAGYAGDGGAGASALLSSPTRLALDRAANLYILDYGNVVVRKLTPAGFITTFAGNTTTGFAGDGERATSASFNNPGQLALDTDGGLYIADTNNNRIRKINTNGIISTVVGNGESSFSTDDSPALATPIDGPSGLAVTPDGTLFFTDRFNNRVRKLSPSKIVTTVAGNGNVGKLDGTARDATFSAPFGLALDPLNNLYIADFGNKLVRRLAAGLVLTFAGNGQYRPLVEGAPASTAFLAGPTHATTDEQGNLYIADTDNARVLRVSPNGRTTTVVGTTTDGTRVNLPCSPTDTAIALNFPSGVALDTSGNLYVADFGPNVVYKISPDSRICRFAGGGTLLNDNVPATSASLGTLFDIAFDARGNLFIAESSTNRIRRVAPNGTITTFAGNGQAAFSGDNGRATDASLNAPYGVAVDASGNVYIADRFNNRIRKVRPNCLTGSGDCIITTVAGNGNLFFNGDGIPATSATIWSPWDVAVDREGNLLIADSENNRIRKVTAPGPNGTITTIAGTGTKGFFGDGGPATSALLNNPTGITTQSNGTILIVDQGNNRVRVIAPTTIQNSIQVSPTQLNFIGTTEGTAESRIINITSSTPGLPFTISASPADWLQITPLSGSTPASLKITVDPRLLQPGPYDATFTLNSPFATPTTVAVRVSFQINMAQAPKLSLDNQNITFAFTSGGAQQTAHVRVANQGGGTISFSASSATSINGNWLQVLPASGTVSASSPTQLTVIVAPGDLAAGTYSGAITVSSRDTGEDITIPVTVVINNALQKILLSQKGLTFVSVQGGSPLPQSFGILNAGLGSMSWTATTTTFSGGESWLSIDQVSGTVASPTDGSLVSVKINPSGLALGTYYGQIQVNVPGAANSPQSLSVILNVVAQGNSPGPELQPTGLIFTGSRQNGQPCLRTASTTCLPPQTVTISNPTATQLTFASSPTYLPAGDWLQYAPSSGTISPGQPATMIFQPDLATLQAGVQQRAAVTLLFDDGTIRTVSVLTVVAPDPTTAAIATTQVAGGCASLLVHPTTLTDMSSNVTVGQPTSIAVRVVDSCGSILTNQNGAVTATFSNGDPPVNLVHTDNGNWSGTWTPRNEHNATDQQANASPGRVTIQFNAFLADDTQLTASSASLTVSLNAGTGPLTFGAANAASGVATLTAPGSLVSIFGQHLADQQGSPDGLRLPTQLSGTQVFLGGRALPLRYVDSGQVNAQIPFDIPIDSIQQLVVHRGTTVSVPQDVVVAAADPAVYTQDSTGLGQIANGITNTLITTDNPPSEGDVIVIYSNGLGTVNPPVPTGEPAPLDGTLSRTNNLVRVTIGGVDAAVSFAGLVPGYADLYQVNTVVPCHADGDVAVSLTVARRTSPAVRLPKPGPPIGRPGLACAQ